MMFNFHETPMTQLQVVASHLSQKSHYSVLSINCVTEPLMVNNKIHPKGVGVGWLYKQEKMYRRKKKLSNHIRST